MSPIEQAWRLVSGGGAIDAEALHAAVTQPETLRSTDPRTRLLVRDALASLRDYWGTQRFAERVCEADLPTFDPREEGFSTIRERLMSPTDPTVLQQMLRELGTRLRTPATIVIGGSLALMLDALIVRATDDVDVVDELPAALRDQHELLDELATRYGLRLTHFQSRFLPDGFDMRTRSLGKFGVLSVRIVDPMDVLVGKLFSRRTRDLDDLRQAWTRIDLAALRSRIGSSTTRLRADPGLLADARRNWYILSGEADLPPVVP